MEASCFSLECACLLLHFSSALMHAGACVFNSFLKWRADIVRALSGLLVCLWKKHSRKHRSLRSKVDRSLPICQKPVKNQLVEQINNQDDFSLLSCSQVSSSHSDCFTWMHPLIDADVVCACSWRLRSVVLTVWCSCVSAALRACWGSRELTADFSRPAARHVKKLLFCSSSDFCTTVGMSLERMQSTHRVMCLAAPWSHASVLWVSVRSLVPSHLDSKLWAHQTWMAALNEFLKGCFKYKNLYGVARLSTHCSAPWSIRRWEAVRYEVFF